MRRVAAADRQQQRWLGNGTLELLARGLEIRGPDALSRNTKVIEYLSSGARLLFEQPDQKMLRANVWAIESRGGNISQLESALCPFRVGSINHECSSIRAQTFAVA